MKKTDVAWAAGIIDGEGCVFISRRRHRTTTSGQAVDYVLGLKVTMGHKPTVERLRDIFGEGTVQNHMPSSSRSNESFSWIAVARQLPSIIKAIKPYSTTKFNELELAEEFLKIKNHWTGGGHGNSFRSVEDMKIRENLYWKMRKLKSRWRFYKEKMIQRGEKFG